MIRVESWLTGFEYDTSQRSSFQAPEKRRTRLDVKLARLYETREAREALFAARMIEVRTPCSASRLLVYQNC